MSCPPAFSQCLHQTDHSECYWCLHGNIPLSNYTPYRWLPRQGGRGWVRERESTILTFSLSLSLDCENYSMAETSLLLATEVRLPYTYIAVQSYCHTLIPSYIHSSICSYRHTFIPAYIPAYIHTAIHLSHHTFIQPYIHSSIHSCLHTLVLPYIHTAFCHVPVLGEAEGSILVSGRRRDSREDFLQTPLLPS